MVVISSNYTTASKADNTQSTQTNYTDQFRLENNTVRYYVTALNNSQSWDMNLTSVFHGIFYMFLFNFRPQQDYVSSNGTIDPKIYSLSIAYNDTPVKINSTTLVNDTVNFISLSYVANATGLYYLAIALIGGTVPDAFILNSNSQIQAYFIPFLPGFPIEWVIIASSFGIWIIRKKVTKNHRNVS
jgi:hypothetical protein